MQEGLHARQQATQFVCICLPPLLAQSAKHTHMHTQLLLLLLLLLLILYRAFS